MLVHTKGIVLRSIKYGETSLIVKVFTEELGLRSYIIQGVRTTKNHYKAAIFNGFHTLDLVVYEKKAEHGLLRIKEYNITQSFENIHRDIGRTATAMYMIEFLNHIVQEEIADRELYGFITYQLALLDDPSISIAEFPLRFTVEMMRYGGIIPSNNYAPSHQLFDPREGLFSPFSHPWSFNETESQYLSSLLNCFELNTYTSGSTNNNKHLRKELMAKILQYFSLHLDYFKEMKSPHILEEIFS